MGTSFRRPSEFSSDSIPSGHQYFSRISHCRNSLSPDCACCSANHSAFARALHHTPDKPFGCRASPFTLHGDTLVVRQRYTCLKCFRDGRKLPAYVAFRDSLFLILGDEQAPAVCEHLAAGGGDLTCLIDPRIYQILKDNDHAKRKYKMRYD
jgi:hypothetical protein